MKHPDKKTILIVSAVLTGISFIMKETIAYHVITIIVMLLSTLVAGLPILIKAVSALRYKIIGIDTLVSIAVIGAIIIGEYWEAAAVTFLFMLGDYLESRTIEKTRSSIRALVDLSPVTARVKKHGIEVEVSADEVLQHDFVIIKHGEKIPVDGVIIEGSAHVNQSAITGESMPVFRQIGDSVFSGTVIESGYLIVDATRVGEDTTFARIVHMVEDAADKKAKTQKFLEKFSKYYTPSIIAASILVFLITRDIRLALTLLVISCPGALVISAPVSIVAGIGNGAKNGVLIKGGDIMEKLGTIKVVAFDKTGTLTTGKPAVTDITSYTMNKDEIIKIAAAGESYSDHPLAKAITEYARKNTGHITMTPLNTEIFTGLGIKFDYENEQYFIGNRALFNVNDIDTDHIEQALVSYEDKGETAVIIGRKSGIDGIISIADTIRPDVKYLSRQLKSLGIKKTVMLTGDNERTAKAIALQTGMDEYHAQLLPEDKVRILNELSNKHGKAAMIGDGVNDAPALASADLGIALGHLGADVAIETADVVLMSEDIACLTYAVGLSRTTVKNMKQNIYFALIVAAFLIAGVLFKSVNLSLGMLIHEASVLLVVINAVRLSGYKEKFKK